MTFALESYRLPLAAAAAGFTGFSHHDALADAEACAAIVVHAAQFHGADDLRQLADTARVSMKRLTPAAPPADTSAPAAAPRRRVVFR